jgi:L-rhamnose-H+ transport protein
VLPWVLAGATISSLGQVYADAGTNAFLVTALFGFLWGGGTILFGVGIAMVGNSMGQTIIIGLCATIGSIVPLVLFHTDQIATTKGICNWASLGLTCVGLVLCAKAGKLKDRDQTKGTEERSQFEDVYSAKEALLDQHEGGKGAAKFTTGLIVCVLSGVMSPCLNFTVVFGKDIKDSAMHVGGASDAISANSVSAVGVSFGSEWGTFMPHTTCL